MATRRTLVLLLGLALPGMRATPAHAQERVTLQLTGFGSSATDQQLRAINTWIDEANPTAHNETDVDLHIEPGNTVNPNVTRRAVVQFDITRIPRAGIKSASLNMWLDTAPSPNSRNWEVLQVTSFNSWALAREITWNKRTNQLSWTAPGGDISGTVLDSTGTGTTNGVTLTWNVLPAVQTWFGGLPPDPNYGFIIKDQTEHTDNTGGAAEEGQLASNSNATLAHTPALVINLIQQVHSLKTTAGDGKVMLTWSYPAQITGSSIVNATTGVVIVRNAGGPVPDTALIQDGTALPTLCGDVNGAGVTVVFESTSLATSFTDPGSCSAPADGTTYFYKVFAIAQVGVSGTYNYSTNGTGPIGSGVDSAFAAEISATPGLTAATQQAPVWMAPVRSASLSAPSIDPGNYAIIGTNNSLVQGFNPATGNDAIAPVSIGGTVHGRLPVLEATEADYGPNTGNGQIPMTFLAADDNLVYDVGLENSGFVFDFLNPANGGLTAGAFTAGVAMQVKAFSNSGNTKPNDVMIMGTHVAGTSPTVNFILAINPCNLSESNPTGPGIGCPSPPNSGAGGGWNIEGGVTTSTGCSSTSSAAVCNIDIITSTPFVDYFRNTVWVTSHNGNTSGQVASPDVWKLDANSGAVLAAVNVGGNIDASPTGTADQSVIFVGTNGGVLLAYDPANTDTGPPVTPHQLGTFTITPNDGAIKGFPLVSNSAPPWTVVVSTNTKVQALSFDTSTNTFSTLWTNSTLGCNPSSPITGRNTTDPLNNPVVFVGCSGGKIHELLLSTGVDEAQRIVDPSGGVVVGDPSLDLIDNEIIVGASDGRVFAFSLPF